MDVKSIKNRELKGFYNSVECLEHDFKNSKLNMMVYRNAADSFLRLADVKLERYDKKVFRETFKRIYDITKAIEKCVHDESVPFEVLLDPQNPLSFFKAFHCEDQIPYDVKKRAEAERSAVVS